MKWFGEPWPRADYRAPVCEDDADRAPTPVGASCSYCNHQISDRDRGVVIPHMGTGTRLDVETYWHLDCFLEAVGVPFEA
jgi:hypothetical protein